MKIKSKTNLKSKQGISLIVLVITIIVMIILAAAIIISLSNNGIINKANEAVDVTDEKQMQVLAATLWADAYMDDKRDAELVTAVKNGLKEVDPNYESKYHVDITNEGVELNKIQDGENEDTWTQIAGEVTLTNAGTDATTGVTTFMLTPGYNIDKVYRLYVESPAYKGRVELTPFKADNTYFSGFYINEDKEMLQVSSLEEAYPYIQGIQAGTIKGEMWINDPTMDAIVVYTTIGKSTDTYKIIKITKSNGIINEYGFYYDTLYKGYLELFQMDVWYYFCPEGYMFNSAGAGLWNINDMEILNTNKIIIDESEITADFSNKVKISKAANGIYMGAFYIRKEQVDNENIVVEYVSFSENVYTHHALKKDGVTDSSLFGIEYDASEFEISNGGKTVDMGNQGIYELLEGPYDVE